MLIWIRGELVSLGNIAADMLNKRGVHFGDEETDQLASAPALQIFYNTIADEPSCYITRPWPEIAKISCNNGIIYLTVHGRIIGTR